MKPTLCPPETLPSRRGKGRGRSPSALLLELGAEEQVGEQEDVAQLAGSLHQLHHEAVLQQLPVLQDGQGRGSSQDRALTPSSPTLRPTFQNLPSISSA